MTRSLAESLAARSDVAAVHYDGAVERFFRAENATLSVGEGTGLGLYMTHAMVEAQTERLELSAGNKTRDDAPNHIRIDRKVRREIAEGWVHMCPAQVYAVAGEASPAGNVVNGYDKYAVYAQDQFEIVKDRLRAVATLVKQHKARKPVVFEGISFFTFRDGLIARYSESFDRGMALAQQDFAAERIKKVLVKLAARQNAGAPPRLISMAIVTSGPGSARSMTRHGPSAALPA